jgi:hypothetical protein
MSKHKEWTSFDNAELTQRWREGQSVTRCAHAMDRTQGSIIGKLARLKLLKDPDRPLPMRAKVVVSPPLEDRPRPSMPRLKWLDNYSIA